MKTKRWIAGTLLAAGTLGAAAPTRFNFDQEAPGRAPAGFRWSVAGHGPQARWQVQNDPQAPSPPHVLTQTGQASGGENYALAIIEGFRPKNGEMTVQFKSISGEEAPGAGFIFRRQDDRNYYLVYANSRDDQCLLLRMRNGKAKVLDTKSAIVTANVWHTMRLVFADKAYMVYLDGELALGSKDKGILEAGEAGLVTKADAVTSFDNLQFSE